MSGEPQVIFATVREAGDDEIHVECRFDDGEKFAAVKVAAGLDEVAHRIADFLSGAPDRHRPTLWRDS